MSSFLVPEGGGPPPLGGVRDQRTKAADGVKPENRDRRPEAGQRRIMAGLYGWAFCWALWLGFLAGLYGWALRLGFLAGLYGWALWGGFMAGLNGAALWGGFMGDL